MSTGSGSDETTLIREPISNMEGEALCASLISGDFIQKVQEHMDPGFKALGLSHDSLLRALTCMSSIDIT
jgi:hypothetical protein